MCECKPNQACNSCAACTPNQTGDIVSPDRSKIVIPKFSVDSALFITYTSFDGDKSKVNIRAVSFPNEKMLLKDLSMLVDDVVNSYSKEFEIVPFLLNPNCFSRSDKSDVMLVSFNQKDRSNGDDLLGYISICVVPNAQNLKKLDTKQGTLETMPLRSYDEGLYDRVRIFLYDEFKSKCQTCMVKSLPHAEKAKDNLTQKDAEKAWFTLLRYYDSYPKITDQMVQVMVTVRKELNKKG